MVWLDGMQLCFKCYKKFVSNPYKKNEMMTNAIRRYRKTIYNLDLSLYKEDFIDKDKIREDLQWFEEIEKGLMFINNESIARENNKILIEYCKKLLKE